MCLWWMCGVRWGREREGGVFMPVIGQIQEGADDCGILQLNYNYCRRKWSQGYNIPYWYTF